MHDRLDLRLTGPHPGLDPNTLYLEGRWGVEATIRVCLPWGQAGIPTPDEVLAWRANMARRLGLTSSLSEAELRQELWG